MQPDALVACVVIVTMRPGELEAAQASVAVATESGQLRSVSRSSSFHAVMSARSRAASADSKAGGKMAPATPPRSGTPDSNSGSSTPPVDVAALAKQAALAMGLAGSGSKDEFDTGGAAQLRVRRLQGSKSRMARVAVLMKAQRPGGVSAVLLIATANQCLRIPLRAEVVVAGEASRDARGVRDIEEEAWEAAKPARAGRAGFVPVVLHFGLSMESAKIDMVAGGGGADVSQEEADFVLPGELVLAPLQAEAEPVGQSSPVGTDAFAAFDAGEGVDELDWGSSDDEEDGDAAAAELLLKQASEQAFIKEVFTLSPDQVRRFDAREAEHAASLAGGWGGAQAFASPAPSEWPRE